MQDAGGDPGVCRIAPHQLLQAAPAHALHKPALHLRVQQRRLGCRLHCDEVQAILCTLSANYVCDIIYFNESAASL